MAMATATRRAVALGARHILAAASSPYSRVIPRRHTSMGAGAAVEKIRAAGLLRTGGLIGGKWVDAYDGKTIEVQNPATGEVLANVACMGSRETSDAIASAHSTFSYIFRPFVGFREVRLVNKESRHPGGDPHVLCFVDFDNPGQATVALEALQGSF